MPLDRESVREIVAGTCLIIATASAAYRGDDKLLWAVTTVTMGYLFRNLLGTLAGGIKALGGGLWRRIRRRG